MLFPTLQVGDELICNYFFMMSSERRVTVRVVSLGFDSFVGQVDVSRLDPVFCVTENPLRFEFTNGIGSYGQPFKASGVGKYGGDVLITIPWGSITI